MTGLDELVIAVIAELPLGEGDLVVTSVELTLPIEPRLARTGALEASWPRGRMVTGFDPPLGTLEVTLTVEEVA
ncbi:MAG TPA: hypothetical protein VLM79_14190 [Kofleriaceae bacterium]|nr:hypothetical protein [Kofleriaceae bacterium]